MITVTISINGSPIFTRSARNISDPPTMHGVNRYKVDSGEIIEHRYEEGAVVLAKMMLDTVRNIDHA
jgi:hypothetical protein